MIFSTQSIIKILTGRKTQTRRFVRYRQYMAGRDYAVQPGRGKQSIARIRALQIGQVSPFEIGTHDAKAEGYQSSEQFSEAWAAMHGNAQRPVWVLEFELLPETVQWYAMPMEIVAGYLAVMERPREMSDRLKRIAARDWFEAMNLAEEYQP